ncbi:hypothetical protein AAF712_015185 [Marasmius tenuissimus]|uniref:Translation initiation factor 3 N-terminal domain-containing protein n=1 Tax=Marasmius tenuissimus TaxID=585030 RepID=A0ABR2ZBH0_9AGAR|nr:hypothetical protein PM082_004751 [Marasmius tenuissimus]
MLSTSPRSTFLAFRASVRELCFNKSTARVCQRRAVHLTSRTQKHKTPSSAPSSGPRLTPRGIPTNIYKDYRPREQKSEVEEVKNEEPEQDEKNKEKLKNKNIPFKKVMFVDPETGGLTEMMMERILADMDSKKYFAELQTAEPFPVVKLISKEEAREAKLKAKEIQKKRNLNKEFQLTWSMGEGDLERKLKRVRETLEKGGRVDLVFAPKSGQRGPPFPVMTERMKATLEGLSDVGKEWKQRQFRSGGIAAAFLQGTESKE